MATNFPATHSEAGKRWAQAYGDYAAAAMSLAGGSPIVQGAVDALGGVLGNLFAGGLAAPAMDAAFVAFWLAPPMAFAGPFPGVVTAVPSVPGLAGVFASNVEGKASADAAMGAIAAALHAFTLTVIVTDATVPTPTVGPIS